MKTINKSLKKYGHRVIILLLIFLHGCASDKKTFVESKSINNWSLKGKIGLAYPKAGCDASDCRKRSDQGSIFWKQLGSVYEISLSDPFGRKVIGVTGGPNQLKAMFPGKEPLVVAPREFLSLMAKNDAQQSALSGLSPNDLRHWITGRPNPDSSFEKNKDTFSQKGFVVSARQWRKTVVGSVPSLVVVKKGNFTLRIVAREWLAIEKE